MGVIEVALTHCEGDLENLIRQSSSAKQKTILQEISSRGRNGATKMIRTQARLWACANRAAPDVVPLLELPGGGHFAPGAGSRHGRYAKGAASGAHFAPGAGDKRGRYAKGAAS